MFGQGPALGATRQTSATVVGTPARPWRRREGSGPSQTGGAPPEGPTPHLTERWLMPAMKPVRGSNLNGTYPRCVWCDHELYVLLVLKYSAGKIGCPKCGGIVPRSYMRRLKK